MLLSCCVGDEVFVDWLLVDLRCWLFIVNTRHLHVRRLDTHSQSMTRHTVAMTRHTVAMTRHTVTILDTQ